MTNPEKDQHFLINKEVLKKEIEVANIEPFEKIIEIGAGNGILTRELLKKTKNVRSFETDKSLKKELKNLFIIYDNALNYSWRDYDKIVSNIPYSISEPVILKAIKEDIKELILIISEKFTKTIKKKEKLGFITNLFFKIEIIQEVKKEDFSPKPRVKSYLIKLTRRKEKNEVESILRNILLRKGKTKNAIIYALVSHGKTKNEAREIIKDFKLKDLEIPIKLISGKFLLDLEKKLKTIF